MLVHHPAIRRISWSLAVCVVAVLLGSPVSAQEKSAFIKGEIEALDEEIESLEETEPWEEAEATTATRRVSIQQPINLIDLTLDADLPVPEVKLAPSSTRNSCATCVTVKAYQWTAPNDVYRNLMFEDPLLERHGISEHPRLQPVISGFKFLKSGFLYPLDVAKGYHKRCDNPLGWGLPGNFCR